MPPERISNIISELLYGAMFTNFFSGRVPDFESQAAEIMDVVLEGILSDSQRQRRRGAQGAGRSAVTAEAIGPSTDIQRDIRLMKTLQLLLKRPHPLPLSRRERGVVQLLLVLSLAVALDGCNHSQAKVGEPPIQEVEVGLPVTKQIVDYVDFTGRTEAMPTIDVRARVSGYLEKVLFREGFDVKEGDVLFLIDPRTYQADYDRAVANLAQARAHLTHMEANYKRAQNLIATRAISQADFDLAVGDRDEAAAAVKVAEAALNTSDLNLKWTQRHGPHQRPHQPAEHRSGQHGRGRQYGSHHAGLPGPHLRLLRRRRGEPRCGSAA